MEQTIVELPKDQVHISVRGLVEFILRSGNIDNRHKASAPTDAMQEGGRIHRMIQSRMGSDYHAEISLKILLEEKDFDILIDGRADGIIIEDSGQVTIDEIKGVYQDIAYLQEPYEVHLSQAKCYAYIYARENQLKNIRIRMTYCNIDTENIKYFHQEYTFFELSRWFDALIEEYKKWAQFTHDWRIQRTESIKAMEFPFPYRKGQKELASQVYRTLYHRKRLFIEAPTGVGKTISTLFPTIKAIGEGLSEKIFYLTAKTITGTVAVETFENLKKNGLLFKTVAITAKDKMCLLEETECNPEACPYANGHYDRINDAIFDLLTTEDTYSREIIWEYAKKHMVCPFELCLDMSLFSDGVICDYNYVFDPNVYLRRFFADGVSGEYIFLVDEAHNLVERGRDMYSASLYKEDFLEIKHLVKPYDKKLEKQLESCNKQLLELKRECEGCNVLDSISAFGMALTRAATQFEKYFEEDPAEIHKEVFDFYLQVRHFMNMYELFDENYVAYSELMGDGRFQIKLFCVHPAKNLHLCMDKANSTILFSATLLPIQYYMNLLSNDPEDYAVYAESTFDERKRALFIGGDVSSRYTRRGPQEYYNIAMYIDKIVQAKKGNYMIFFPSHAFLNNIYETYCEYFQTEDVEIIVQESSMDEKEREEFLNSFRLNSNVGDTQRLDLTELIQMDIEIEENKTLLGFCVMGGIFSEGIDLKNDSLIGSIIVGTGLPQVCNEREILKAYFDEAGMNGFDYAYRFPGMNKVLQAAGRVIRTAEDEGVIALLDERFASGQYRRLFPREWQHVEKASINLIGEKVAEFWRGK